MKIEIEISEINAASIWADNWKGKHDPKSLEQLIQGLVADAGAHYRNTFQFGIEAEKKLVGEFLEAFPQHRKVAAQ